MFTFQWKQLCSGRESDFDLNPDRLHRTDDRMYDDGGRKLSEPDTKSHKGHVTFDWLSDECLAWQVVCSTDTGDEIQFPIWKSIQYIHSCRCGGGGIRNLHSLWSVPFWGALSIVAAYWNAIYKICFVCECFDSIRRTPPLLHVDWSDHFAFMRNIYVSQKMHPSGEHLRFLESARIKNSTAKLQNKLGCTTFFHKYIQKVFRINY